MNEVPFRIALFVIIVLLGSVVLYFRRQAANPRERINYDAEGFMLRVALRMAAMMMWLSTLVYLAAPSWIAAASIPIATAFRWLGFSTAVLASLFMIWTLKCLGKNLTDTVVTRSDASLVTFGPYRWVRHPYYSATAMVMMSVTILTANWLIGLSSALVLAILAIRTRTEEAKLVERFGTEYLAYQARTSMFVPRLMQKRSRY